MVVPCSASRAAASARWRFLQRRWTYSWLWVLKSWLWVLQAEHDQCGTGAEGAAGGAAVDVVDKMDAAGGM